MTRVALITLHGMGRTSATYAEGLFATLRDRLDAGEAAAASFNAVWYQRELQENQDLLWQRVSSEYRLDWQSLRRFVLFNLSDAVGLEAGKDELESSYRSAQTRIAQALLEARAEMQRSGPVVVLAKSLGGQVFSSYVYDAQRLLQSERGERTPPSAGIWRSRAVLAETLGRAIDDDELEYLRGATVVALLTTGCNIPVFVSAHRQMSVRAIAAPNERFEWHNFFDPDDVFGWPLQPLEGGYRELVRDHLVQVGNLFTGWTPLSHDGYWRDGAVLDAVIAQLRRAMASIAATPLGAADG